MKITIVQGAFFPVPPLAGGAVEKLWFELGREFARRGFAVTHLSRRWPGLPTSAEADGVAHRRVAGYDYPRWPLLAKAMDLIYSIRCLFSIERSDVIVTNTFFLPLLLTLLGRRGAIYVSVHRYPHGQMRLYRRVDRLQCVSSVIANAVREQAPSVSRLVKVVPNFVPARRTEQEVAASWAERRWEVLFVGRLHPEKGIDLLLEAYAQIDTQLRAGWTLRIVGPHATAAGGGGADFLAALQQRAAAQGIVVDWSGPIYDATDLESAYRRARIFVYPSVAAQGEAFPLAPLEAMAAGCPVVTSDLACFADFIRSGINAETFAVAGTDAAPRLRAVLESLMQDDGKLQAYSREGSRTAQDFSLQRVADLFIEDFSSLQAP